MTATTLERTNQTMQDTPSIEPEGPCGASCGQMGQHVEYDLDSRARDAAARYLKIRDYEVLDRDWECDDGDCIDIVCQDIDGTLVFVDVTTSVSCFPREECIRGRRAKLEAMAMSYLAEHEDDVDIPIRFDSVGIVPVGENRAFLRHHSNVLGMM